MVESKRIATEVGVIPEDWNAIKVENIANVKTGPFGSALHAEDYVMEGTPIITVEHLGDEGFTRQKLPLVSAADKKRLSGYVLKQGDIAFSRVGSVDRNAYVTEVEDGWLFSGRILRIRVTDSNVDSRYLGYHFKLEETKKRIRNVAVGQTMASLNTKIMNSFHIALPPTIDEQKNISHALSEIDELTDNLRKLIEKKKNIRLGTIQQLITGNRRLPGFNAEWKEYTLGEECRFYSGGTPSTKNSAYWAGNIPWVSSSDLIEGDIFHLNETRFITTGAISESATQLCPPNCILVVSRVGVGKIVICDHEVCTSQDFTNLYLEKHNPVFVAYKLLPVMKELAITAQGTSIKGVSSDDIKAISLLLPEADEQDAVVGLLRDMDDEIYQLQMALEKYINIRNGMMDDLLTGKIRLV